MYAPHFRLFQTLVLSLCFAAGAVAGGHGGGEGGEGKSEAGAGEYMDIKPALITNYGGPGPIHFVKAEIALRVGKAPDVREAVVHHMPRIRHELIMLLSKQSDTDLESMEGKEKLRQDALSTIQKLMEEEAGKKAIDDLLFTNFVVQR